MPEVLKHSLPIDQFLGEIARTVVESPALIIEAEPGAGKTTRVPLVLDEALPGKVLVLEPRRLAAKLSAGHMAANLGQAVGQRIGYQVRYEKALGDATSIIFLTEGMFLRMLAANPKLEGVSCVVLDEFHERSLNTDLALGFVKALQAQRRPDLKLVVMSATMDVTRLKTYLGDCRLFTVPGRQFPVAIEYKPAPKMTNQEDQVADAAVAMFGDRRCAQSVLVFLPGTREIMAAMEVCKKRLASTDIDVCALTAELPTEQQRLAFDTGRRRLILATNVAETSLTIPGITGVIDTGLAKIAGHAHWSGMPTLQIKDVSQASVAQRSGRAGRLQAGVVYRLFSEASFLARDAYTLPEIKRADLSTCALEISALQSITSGSEETFPWFEPPDERLWETAQLLLRRLGLLDKEGRITERGRRAHQLPLHPRAAVVLLSGEDVDKRPAGVLAAALINEGFILGRQHPAEERRNCDVLYQLEVMKDLLTNNDLSAGKLHRHLDTRRIGAVARLFKALHRGRLDELDLPTQSELASWLLNGYPDRVAKLRKLAVRRSKLQRRPMYHFCLGKGGMLSEQSGLSGKEPFVIAVDAQENLRHADAAKSTVIRVGSVVDVEQLLACASSGLIKQQREDRQNPQTGELTPVLATYYGEFIIKEDELAEAQDVDQLAALIKSKWPWPFSDDSDVSRFNHKARLLASHGFQPQLPVFRGEMLEIFIESMLTGVTSLDELLRTSLQDHIMQQLSYEEQELLRVHTPDIIKLSNGKILPLSYAETGCSVSGYIQDFYGVKQNLSLLNQRCPIRIILLGPNRRPAQITTDLHGFWERGYFEVRRELQRRYPRHYWPDAPATSQPFLTKKQAERT